MLYKRQPQYNRRYSHLGTAPSAPENPGIINRNALRRIESIPLPNEREDINELRMSPGYMPKSGLPDILRNVLKNIQLEEIILIALIFLLLEEGIDDEFLLIMLVYILLF